MAGNFEIIYEGKNSPENAGASLRAEARFAGRKGREMVTDIAQYAGKRMKAYVPIRSGRLRKSVYADLQATPLRDPGTGRFVGGGRGWYARAGIRDLSGPISEVGIANRAFGMTPGALGQKPSAYAIPVNDGSSAIDLAPGNVMVMVKEENPIRTVKGRQVRRKKPRPLVFTTKRRAIPGTFFIEKTQADVLQEAERRTRFFRER